MFKLKNKWLSIMVFMIPIFMFSQSIEVDMGTRYGFAYKDISNSMGEVSGSPYIKENFQSVKIKNQGEKIYNGRYNAYLNEMEILLDTNKNPIALDIENNDYEVHFINENKTYKTYTYSTEKGIQKRGFLVVVSELNNTFLLREEIIKYYDKILATSSYDQDKPAKFRREADNYYIALSDGEIVHLPNRSKDLAQSFPNKSKEISTFIKKNNIKTKREEDLIKLASYIGTL